jgi:hypothetical protein
MSKKARTKGQGGKWRKEEKGEERSMRKGVEEGRKKRGKKDEEGSG